MSSTSPRLPDPALVVLVGAAGSGKSTWAAGRYRSEEVVSSDALRGVVGSGVHDLDATADAFALLERIVDARLGRGLTTVVDTLGLDEVRRGRWLAAARAAGLPAVVVLLDTAEEICRARNAGRDRPVPAPALVAQLRRQRMVREQLTTEGWDEVLTVDGGRIEEDSASAPARLEHRPAPDRRTSQGLRVVLQVSRFPWGEEPATWLAAVARSAEETGFAGLSLMDHLIQVPQVGRTWEPIPEPWVTLGLLAAVTDELALGTLVTPVTFRPPGITAKAAATLDALSGGRAFVGIGAGWWAREHAAYGLPFPPAATRLDQVEAAIETMRALWAPGTKGHDGDRVVLPETTCYPRPSHRIPVIVGGGGERRTLRIAARLADGANVSSDLDTLDRKAAILRRHCRQVGRDPAEVAITVLDLPVVGRDRDDTWARVERLRGRSPAAAFARRTHAGPPAAHRDRYGALADRGVDTVFLGLPDLDDPGDLARVAALVR